MNPNNLPTTAPARNILATLEDSPNEYIKYPALGNIYVHEFDIHGNVHVVGFQQYQTDGTFGPPVQLGLARDCKWQPGFQVGARVATSFADKQALRAITW